MLNRSNVQRINNVEDHDDFIQNNDKCIMYFGSQNCQKCRTMMPVFEDVARNYPNVKFSYVDVAKTNVEDLGQELPVFVCYKNNNPVGKIIGTNKNGIINMIQNNFDVANNNNSAMIEINDINTYNKFVSNNKKCLVFFGSEKCPHCRDIKPYIIQMSNQYPSIKFCHIEVSNKTYDIIPKQYQNSGFPLILCYKDSKLVDNVLGADKEGISTMIQNL